MRLFMTTLVLLAAASAGASAQDDPWLGRDKGLHFAAGAAIGFGGYFASSLVFDGRGPRMVVGLSLGLGAGVAKELRDRRGGGTASWRDFAWTAGGTAVGVTAGWLIDRAHARPCGAPAPGCAPVGIRSARARTGPVARSLTAVQHR
jgi:putative lipoprotein